MYAVTRLKVAKNAWCWRINFRRRRKTYSRGFHDLKHGGSKKALAAALAWRDRQLAGAKILTFREFCAYRRSNNTSGVAGVHFLRSAAQPRGAWQAKIKLPDGRKVTKNFGVGRFGNRQAFKHAVAARAKLLDLVADRPYLYNATAKKFAARAAAKEKRSTDMRTGHRAKQASRVLTRQSAFILCDRSFWFGRKNTVEPDSGNHIDDADRRTKKPPDITPRFLQEDRRDR